MKIYIPVLVLLLVNFVAVTNAELQPCDYWKIKEICRPDISLTQAVNRVDQAINVQEAKRDRVRDEVCSPANREALQNFIECAINRAKSTYRCLSYEQLVNDTLFRSTVTPTTIWRDTSGLIERIRLDSNNPAYNTLSDVLILLFPGSTLCDSEDRMYDYAEYRYCMLDYSGYLRNPKCIATEAFLAIDNANSETMCSFFEKIIDCVLVGIQSACRKSSRNGLKTFYVEWVAKEIRRIFQSIHRLKDVPFHNFNQECDPMGYVARTLDNWDFTPVDPHDPTSTGAQIDFMKTLPFLLLLPFLYLF